MFIENSKEDLVARGFTQEQILNMIGEDVGYHARSCRDALKNVDRLQYKLDYALSHFDKNFALDVLKEFSEAKLSKDEILSRFGISAGDSGKLIKLEELFAAYDLSSEYSTAFKSYQAKKRSDGSIAKFGTSNVFELPEYQDKAKATRVKKYGGEYTLSRDSVLADKARQTFSEHMQDAEFREDMNNRKIATCMEHYGVEHPAQYEDIKKVISEKVAADRAAYPEKYEYAHRPFSEESKQKARETCLQKYGEEYYARTEEARQAQSERMQRDYPEIFAKMQATMVERYGAPLYRQSDDFKKFMAEYMKEHAAEIREKSRTTCLERYGVEYWVQTAYARAMQSERMRLYMKDHADEVLEAAIAAKRKNGTFSVSKPESDMCNILLELYPDVQFQYRDKNRYPFLCYAYIPSRDLFIELNAMWIHGFHWYDGTMASKQKLDIWKRKSLNSDFYKEAIDVWTVRDVEKRRTAKDNNLNYVVFWDNNLNDFYMWIALGCPDASDWKIEYSWLDDSLVLSYLNNDYPLSNFSEKSISSYIRHIQNRVVFSREYDLWNKNALYSRKNISLRKWLYLNRFQYNNHILPGENTTYGLLRAFSISGILRAYSSFNLKLYSEVLINYPSSKIYDPCAGWGERLLYCGLNNKHYVGVDINDKLFDGYDKIIKNNHLENVQVYCGDSSQYDISQHYQPDICITCPPYFNTEIYTDKGAENMSYADFLSWWDAVVKQCTKSTASTFAFQINQAFKSDMSNVILSNGWHFAEELVLDNNSQTSHFNRKDGTITKKEFESMMVFIR